MNATMCEQLSFQYTPSISFNYLGQFDQLFSSDAMFIPENEFKRLDHAAGSKRSHVIDVIGVVRMENFNSLGYTMLDNLPNQRFKVLHRICYIN
ncbi:hypothetical protein HFP67_28220 [Bacillus sp. CB102A.1]